MVRIKPLIYSLIVLISACQPSPGSEYHRLVKKELATDRRHDDLFMGVRFGMTSKEFYAYCWEMNKKGLFTDGNNNTAVLYKMDTGFAHPVFMNFYPDFHEGRIANLSATFAYSAWAPWNKTLFSDSLLPGVLALYRKWLPGNDFLTLTDPKKGTIYIKVDGNRRIIIGRYDDQNVKVDYTDLLVDKK
jgi:hypothetical protein